MLKEMYNHQFTKQINLTEKVYWQKYLKTNNIQGNQLFNSSN
jgi:hypothetical protein